MNNVCYIPSMKKNLISISQIMNKGYSILFGPNIAENYTNVKASGELITQGKKVKEFYIMSTSNSFVDQTLEYDTTDLWHASLFHVNYNIFQDMIN